MITALFIKPVPCSQNFFGIAVCTVFKQIPIKIIAFVFKACLKYE